MFNWFKKIREYVSNNPYEDDRAFIKFYSDAQYEIHGTFTYEDIIDNQLWLILPTNVIKEVVMKMTAEDKGKLAQFSNDRIKESQKQNKEPYVSAINAYRNSTNEVR